MIISSKNSSLRHNPYFGIFIQLFNYCINIDESSKCNSCNKQTTYIILPQHTQVPRHPCYKNSAPGFHHNVPYGPWKRCRLLYPDRCSLGGVHLTRLCPGDKIKNQNMLCNYHQPRFNPLFGPTHFFIFHSAQCHN